MDLAWLLDTYELLNMISKALATSTVVIRAKL